MNNLGLVANDTAAKNPRVPPHSIAAEQSVLGTLMLDNQAWDLVSSIVGSVDFYRREHSLLFTAIEELAKHNKPFDVLTIKESLQDKNVLQEAGGEVYLFEIANGVPSVSNVTAYAEIIREKSILRQLIQTSTNVANYAFNPEGKDTLELLDLAESEILKIGLQNSANQGPVHIQKLLSKTVDKIDELSQSESGITGLETGFVDLDGLTSGLQSSDLVIVAGRPSMGKTILGVNILEHAAIKGNAPVLMFSLEMPGDAIAMRMISSLGMIDQQKLRSGNLADADWARISSTMNVLSEANIFIDDTPNLSPTEIRS